jgi:hypothetical protein
MVGTRGEGVWILAKDSDDALLMAPWFREKYPNACTVYIRGFDTFPDWWDIMDERGDRLTEHCATEAEALVVAWEAK